MALSSWPADWEDDVSEPKQIIRVEFGESVLVKTETEKAIGLQFGDDDKSTWIPKSQIGGKCPSRGEWIDSIQIPQWLADEHGWESE